jgi:hypothetical protein
MRVENQENQTLFTGFQRPEVPKTRAGKVLWKKLSSQEPDLLLQIIEEESEVFLTTHGTINQHLLAREGRYDLAAALYRYYPDRLRGLRRKFSLPVSTRQRPRGYWCNTQTIENEAMQVYQELGGLSNPLLRELKHLALQRAINVHYPGGMVALQAKLGAEATRKMTGFWTPENIEREAMSYYRKHGVLNHKALRKSGSQSLSGHISTNYPGGMQDLKEKLGLNIQPILESISSKEANEDLERLLE